MVTNVGVRGEPMADEEAAGGGGGGGGAVGGHNTSSGGSVGGRNTSGGGGDGADALRFNPSIYGHWMKFAELMLGLAMTVIGALWLAGLGASCMAFLEGPILAMGCMLVGVSMVGIVGACRNNRKLNWAHLIGLFLVLLLLCCFTIFTLEVTRLPSAASPVRGHPVPGMAFHEFLLTDYLKWWRHRVNDPRRWSRVVDCLKRSGFCSSRLPYHGSNQTLYDQTPLSPIQSGCCKPPLACNFTFMDATHWSMASSMDASNEDCKRWSNDPSILCYGCNSCKAGVIQATITRWRKARTLLLFSLIVVISLYAFCGCGLFQSDEDENG